MKKIFIKEVIRLTSATEETIAFMPQKDIMEKYVFPEILYPTGQDTRGWRISDTYLKFVEDFAEYCLQEDSYTGSYMLKFALNRLSWGAVLHEPLKLNDLPDDYKKYGVQNDQYGLMSNQCFMFLHNTSYLCVDNEITREHFKRIIFGLISHLSPYGENQGRFIFGGVGFDHSSTEVLEWAEKQAEVYFDDDLYCFLATPKFWKGYQKYFSARKASKNLNKKDFFNRIGESGFFNKEKIWKNL
ncbi:MAG: hypothetical protein R3Y43_05685 [Alphaproteobacteria bacterium]